MKKILIITLLLCAFTSYLLSQDTVTIHYFTNNNISASVITYGDDGIVSVFNEAGHLIFKQEYNLEEEVVDYSISYYENGGVENISLSMDKNKSDVTESYDIWFDKKGRDITGIRMTDVDTEFETEGGTFEFEGGIIFRKNDDK